MKYIKYLAILTFFWSNALAAQPGPDDGLLFNGIDEFMLIPDSDNINTRPVSNRTIETYFKVDDATNRQTLYKEGGQVNSIKFIIEGGYLYLGCYRNSGGNGNLIYFRKPINNNTWYHVALVLDNASTLKFYLDGVLQDERPDFFQIPNHPGDFEIARTSTNTRYPACDTWTSAGLSEYCRDNISNNDPSKNYFGGRVWGFRIWDVVRTAQEIDDNKDLLITDTSTSPGDQLLAFIDDDGINYQDDDGVFDQEVVDSEDVLSINEFELDNYKIYREYDDLIVALPSGEIIEHLELFDLTGRSVRSIALSDALNISNLSKGVYILKISTNTQTKSQNILLR